MACFLVPAAEAAITSVAAKKMKENEKEESVQVSLTEGKVEEATKIKFSTKLGWLNKMLLASVETLVELFNSTACIYELLLSGKERMTV